jgi:hypothetical protein
MVLGESYLKGILRPPLADVKALPPNPPHPFQTDFGFYLRQRFLKNHFPLVVGFAVAIWAFSAADQAMRDGKKRAYDEAIAAGRSPCECMARRRGRGVGKVGAWLAGAAAGCAPCNPRPRVRARQAQPPDPDSCSSAAVVADAHAAASGTSTCKAVKAQWQ